MEFPVAEGAMPATVIRAKEKIRLMSAEEKKEYFKGKTPEQLQKMARSHGYGENSDVYAKYATETVAEDGGTSSAGAIASVNNPGGKPKSQVGSLFGGTYQRKKKTTGK
jgi:hypothetical protein